MKRFAPTLFVLLLLPSIALADTNNASVLANLYTTVLGLASKIEAIQAQQSTNTSTECLMNAPTCVLTIDPDLIYSVSDTSGKLTTIGFLVSWKSTNATSGTLTGIDENSGLPWQADLNPVASGSITESAPAYSGHTYKFTATFTGAGGTTSCVGTLFLMD